MAASEDFKRMSERFRECHDEVAVKEAAATAARLAYRHRETLGILDPYHPGKPPSGDDSPYTPEKLETRLRVLPGIFAKLGLPFQGGGPWPGDYDRHNGKADRQCWWLCWSSLTAIIALSFSSRFSPSLAFPRYKTVAVNHDQGTTLATGKIESADWHRVAMDYADVCDFLAEQLAEGQAEAVAVIDLVTLDQISAIVHRSKETVRKYRWLPSPENEPRRGQSKLYSWAKVHPLAEEHLGMKLSAQFPGDRFFEKS